MNFADQVRVLQKAEGRPALLALSTVDIAHNHLPTEERTRIKEALIAAAVPHWCDREFLAALLETTPDDIESLLGQLRVLAVVEPFPARGQRTINVHEATRGALRGYLRATNFARWQALSSRAGAFVSNQTAKHARIEAVYHLFATNEAAATASCKKLRGRFAGQRRVEFTYALRLAIEEISAEGWLTDPDQVAALLVPFEPGISRGRNHHVSLTTNNSRAVREASTGRTQSRKTVAVSPEVTAIGKYQIIGELGAGGMGKRLLGT